MSMLTDIEAKKIMQQLIKSAVPFTFKTYSKKQFVNDFNSDGVINTPIGEIQLAEEQIEKLFSKNRMGFYGLIKPTLTNPLLILPTWDKNNVQATTFIKTFFNKCNNTLYFGAFARKKEILEIISLHPKNENQIIEIIKKGYKHKQYQEDILKFPTALDGLAKSHPPKLVFVHIGVPFSNTNVVNKNKMKNLNFINASTDILTHKEAQELGILNNYGLKESDQYEITENGLELVKKIEARLQTLKAKKSGTDLFPELNGTNPDVGLSFIERFVLMDNKKISENELANFFTDLANAIKSKKITKQHPYSKTINNISDRLYSIYKTLNLKESVLIEIKDVKELKSLLEKEQNGLGFLPLVVSAVAGKIVEKAIEKKLSPKSLDGYDVDGYYFDSIPKAKNNILTDESNLKQSIIEIREHLINNRTKQRNDSTGWFIEINNESIRKWFSKPLGFIKLKAFTAINDIIKVGVLIKTEKANKKLNKREKVHQFWSIVQVDGKNYPFGFLVIEKEGKFIYNTTLIPVEKTIKPTGLAGFKFVENFPFIPKLKQSAINKTSKVKVQKKSTPKNNSLAGVLSTAQMAGFTYKEIALNPYYAKILGKPATNFDMCIHGEPGSGKTVFLLKLANYLAENFGKVVYVTTEEFGSATLTKKIKDFNINSKNLFFTDKLEKINPSDFAFMFVDSVNHSGLKLADYKEMRIKHPNTAVILILQTTKGGTYKGGKDWPHEVEICARLFKNEKGQRMIEITKDRYTDLRTVKI